MRPLPPELLELVRSEEGLHDGDKRTAILEPERDPLGLWSIGWGHCLSADASIPRPNVRITLAEAEELLVEDLQRAAGSVLRLVAVPLTDGQFAALVDFAYNLGGAALQASTLRRRVNAGDPGAADEFGKWVFGGRPPRKLAGLVRRRARERALFLA